MRMATRDGITVEHDLEIGVATDLNRGLFELKAARQRPAVRRVEQHDARVRFGLRRRSAADMRDDGVVLGTGHVGLDYTPIRRLARFGNVRPGRSSDSGQMKGAPRHRYRRSAYLDRLDSLARATDSREENARSAELRSLLDPNLVAKSDPTVTGEMRRERPRRRSGSGVLVDPGFRREHARLPFALRTRKRRNAVRRELEDSSKIGLERSDQLA